MSAGPADLVRPLRRMHLTSTIAGRLLLGFLLVSLVPVGVLVAITYSLTRDGLTEAIESNLAALADARASQIDTYVQERERAVTVLSRQPEVARALADFRAALPGGADGPAYRRAEQRQRPALARFVNISAFADLLLVGDDGRIVFSIRRPDDLGTSLHDGPFRGSALAAVFDRARTLLNTEMSDFVLERPDGPPVAFVAAPVIHNGQVAGILVLQVNTEDFSHLIADYTGLGRTGETVVGALFGEKAVVIAPLRHDPQAAFRRSAAIGSPLLGGLQKAVQGIRGHGLTTDYRGERTVAAWRYLPALGAGMVVKIDAAEALEPVRRQLDVLLVLGGTVIAAAVVTAIVLARTVAMPLRRLTAAARAVADGDLSQSVPVTSTDELGIFATTFNQMTRDLRRTYETIEETVILRTEQLRHETETVQALNRQIMDSLTYAARIQRSLLPTPEALLPWLDDLAIRWQPRDVVGGDFYWWHATPDGFTVVLADCTGHGVPGAFMTIIVSSALDRLRRENRLHDPARLLADVDGMVKRALHQAGGDSLSDDGLDAAVCMVSRRAGTLTFAGARLPLLIECGGEVREIRGDRKSVGYRTIDIGAGFTNHTVPLEAGSSFWLLTDGLTDQLGADRPVAFGRTRVRAALTGASGSLEAQAGAVLLALDLHQGGGPRLDDLTLIGFRPRPMAPPGTTRDAAGANNVKQLLESC